MRDLQDSRAIPDFVGLRAAWRTALDRELKQTPFERLTQLSDDAIAIAPIYAPDDLDALQGTISVPPRVGGRFDVTTLVRAEDPGLAEQIARDADGGSDGLLVVGVPDEAHLDALARFSGTLALDCGPWAPALAAALTSRGARDVRGGFDPIATLASSGRLPFGPRRLGELVASLVDTGRVGRSRPLAVDTRVFSEAGAPPAMALGIGLAVAVDAARSLHGRGVAAAAFFDALEFRIAVDSDTFVEIARLRALRAVLARVGELLGATEAALRVPIHAFQSIRSVSAVDPWVNLLRSTHAAFVAATGGADSVTLVPFDAACGVSDDLARRIARNTALVLRDESHLARVDDPAAGSWYVESLTTNVARRAWATMQETEAAGGAFASVLNGQLAARIQPVAAARSLDIARRRRPITGVSEFPAPSMPPLVRAPSVSAVPAGAAAVTHEADVASAVRNFGVVGGTAALAVAGDEFTCAAIPSIRDAAQFEALRARTAGAREGLVFAAALGERGDFRARAEWTTNALGTAGLVVPIEATFADAASARAAFVASRAPTALIVGSDAACEAMATLVARELKAAGARCVILAQKPRDPAPLRDAGVDLFVHVGCDLPALLHPLLDAAGVAR